MSIPAKSDGEPSLATKSATPRTAVLILGMHRSGTSALARLLNLRGADLGRDLLPAQADNERGFWENRAILALHARFLDDIGVTWHDLAACPPHWQQSLAGRRLVADLPAVLLEQFGDNATIAIKDPRLSLLVPLWNEALAALAVQPRFVVMVRDADEVAASLAARDGFAPVHSRLLWLQHVIEAERGTRGQSRTFVHYERLLDDWRGELARISAALDLHWPDAAADFDAQAAAFIAPSLRHQRAHSTTPAAAPDLVRRTYDLALAAASGQREPDREFERMAAEFDRAMPLLEPLHREATRRMAQLAAQHAAEIEAARHAIDAKDQEIAQARANIDALAGQVAQARDALQVRSDEIARARTAFAAKEQEIDAARAVIAGKDAQIDAARDTVARKDAEIAAARDTVAVLSAQIRQASEAHAEQQRDLDSRAAAIDSLRSELDGARNNIDALVAEIGRAREAHGLRDVTEAHLRAELQLIRQSRWFRLGRKLRVLDRDPA